MSKQAVISTNNLTKVYHPRSKKRTLALDKLTLNVEQGEVFGFLGPNGAGKTTTIRLLLDLIRPTEGDATVFGKDVREHSVDIHGSIGFMPGELNLWKNRTAKQVIHYVASVRGNEVAQKKEAQELAERLKFDLTKKVGEYSTGNKRKLGIILALMHSPELLILDEPTSGLDPLMQQTFHQMMQEYKAQGRTVFLSSHVLSEVQAICDRVGILRDGQLKAVERVEQLTRVEFQQISISLRDPVPQEWMSRLKTLNGATDVEINDHSIRLKLNGDFDPLLRVISEGYVKELRMEEPTLEDIFLTYYGNGRHATREREVEVIS